MFSNKDTEIVEILVEMKTYQNLLKFGKTDPDSCSEAPGRSIFNTDLLKIHVH